MVNWSDIFAGEGAGEEVLGECIQHVFPRNISCIFSDTVRIGRDHENCVLHAAQPLSTGKKTVHTSIYWFVQVHTSMFIECTGMYQYVLVHLYMNVLLNSDINSSVYLWVHVMKAPPWKVEGIASGSHYAPEHLRL